jgi:hypothetical protein
MNFLFDVDDKVKLKADKEGIVYLVTGYDPYDNTIRLMDDLGFVEWERPEDLILYKKRPLKNPFEEFYDNSKFCE